jgi:hypothetical protein
MPLPAAPTNFIVSRVGIDHTSAVVNKAAVRFTFTNNQPGATHVIQQSLNGTSGWKDVLEVGDGDAAAVLAKLALNDKFWWRIRSEFAAQGTFSAWLLATTNPTQTAKLPTAAVQINAPAGLAVTNNDYRNVTITWTDNATNESDHILRVAGPGLPAGGVDVPIYHLDSGKFVFPIGFPFYSSYALQNAKTYTVNVRARGGKQTTVANTFDTDASADLTFTTAAFRVALVNVPASPTVNRGQPFSYRLIANTTAAFSIVAGALPAGLTLVADTISGTTTVADANINVTIRADDGATHDEQILTLKVQTPLFKFTNLPATVQAWNSVNFQFSTATNIPAEAGTVILSGALPLNLADDGGGHVEGIPNAVDGPYPVAFRATNTLGTTTDGTLNIQVSTPSIRVLLKPHGTTQVPKPGENWGTVSASLGVLFQWDISAQAIGPIAVGNAVTLVSGPAWLSLSGTTLLTGTPDTSGDAAIVVRWSNGTFEGETTLQIAVPSIQITNANNLSVYEGQTFSFPLSSSPTGVFGFSDSDEVPEGIAIRSNSPGHYVLAGTVDKVGVYSFEIVAVAGQDRTTQQFTLTVRSLIEVEGGDLIQGFQNEPVLQILSFKGEGTVSEWFLVDAPPGVEISTELSCPGPYEGTKTVVAIAGRPTVNGRFESTILVQICRDGLPEIHRHSITFEIRGGYYVPEIHNDRSLYDLQFQIRGNVLNRAIGSYYGVAAKDGEPAKKTVQTVKSTIPGNAGVTSTVTEEGPVVGAAPARVLVMKRDDVIALAILVRDGRAILGTVDGVTDVKLLMRLMDSADGEYLFQMDATPTPAEGVEYFRVDLAVTSAFLTDLMGDDGLLSKPVQVVAEIRCKVNGAPMASDTALFEIAEDLYTEA